MPSISRVKPGENHHQRLRSMLSQRERWPLLMGILNVTPDSFSDGGAFVTADAAFDHALQLYRDGADIIDIGGESTRPGACSVTLEEEQRRVIPVVQRVRAALPELPLSVDTSKPAVMYAAAKAGVSMINDVRALQQPGALQAGLELGLPVVLMHMQGSPPTMQQQPQYQQLLAEVLGFLWQRVRACEDAGIERQNLVIDPGFGFGKTLQHNLSLLAHLDRFTATGLAVLVGVSRKSMLSALLDRALDERLVGSIALALEAAAHGAAILRVHDVRETFDARKVRWELTACRQSISENLAVGL